MLIRNWLDTHGLADYASAFEENEIDLDAARDLNEDDLRELGIPMGPRKKLLRAIAALAADGGSWGFISGLCRLKEAADQIRVLLAGCTFDARGDIDGGRAGQRECARRTPNAQDCVSWPPE